jgi:hypothetical protein
MKIRAYVAETDYPLLASWWQRRGLPAVPQQLLPEFGAFAHVGNIDVAAGFVYFEEKGRVAVVDWISTNPTVASGPTTLEAVAHLIRFFEDAAKNRGCANVFSFVAQNTGLHRLMVRAGWQDPKSVPHIVLFKSWPSPA